MMNLKKSILWMSLFCGVNFAAEASNSANIALKGNLIVNPPCELTSTTGGNTIAVEFGDIVIRKMSTSQSGRAYKQPLPYKLVCDAPNDTGIYIFLSSEKAAKFDNRFVGTTNDNVGIMFLNNNGLVTRIGNPAGMRVGKQTVMEVVPIRNNANGITVESGEFTATATLTVAYQ